MASSIHKYMDDLALQMVCMPSPTNDKVNYFLKALETFLLCATKLRENGDGSMEESMTSLLVRIDHAICEYAQSFEVYCREGYHGALLVEKIHRFEADMKSFEKEIDGLYTVLSESLLLWTIEDAVEVIDSVLDNLETFHSLCFSEISGATEALEEKMRFFASFIRFAAMESVENKKFVVHVTSVAFDAAHLTSHLSGFLNAGNPHGWKQMEPEVLALLQKMRPIHDTGVLEAYKTALQAAFRYSQTLDHTVMKGFVDFLLWCLWEALEMDLILNDSTKARVRPLWEGLKSLRATLTEYPCKFDEDIIRNVICNAGVIIFSLHHQDFEMDVGIPDLLEKFAMIQVKSTEDQIPVRCSPVDSAGIQTNMDSVKTTWEDQTVGLEEDTDNVVEQLTEAGWSWLRVFPIVGMAGIGKTTLAVKVFNHPEIASYFQYRAWCCVSQVYDKRKLLLELLTQICPSGPYHDMGEVGLANQLQKSLEGTTYLLVLDEVWDLEAWNSLKASFPDGWSGSRVLLTSRDSAVTSQVDNSDKPYSVRPLTDNQSWELLQKRLFPKGNCPLKLYQIGKQIAAACGGLPLTVVIAAGLLTTTEPDAWKKVLESISSGFISRSKQIVHTLELSYKHLPEYLKPCFLYTAFFPEDEGFQSSG